jgi:hypothetical protein
MRQWPVAPCRRHGGRGLTLLDGAAIITSAAEVAELADALDSKSCARKGVRVRLPPSALIDDRV